jgi:hypothetical protein
MGRWFLAALFLMVFVTLGLSSAVQKSATWDETHYLGLGIDYPNNFGWNIPSISLHPPLSYYLNSLPLLFCDVQTDCYKQGEAWDIMSGVRRGQCLMKGSDPNGDRLLLLSRIPSVFLGLLLGITLFHWSCQLFGTGGGFISLFLFSLSPNMLAHSRLITPDIPLTTFGFISAYYFWKTIRENNLRDKILCGLFLGLTLLSKYSGLIWIAIFLILWIMVLAGNQKHSSSSPLQSAGWGAMVKTVALVVGTALFVLWVGYGFQILEYLRGSMVQAGIVGRGLPSFLNGRISEAGGWWTYYISAFFMKVPIPLLLFMTAAVLLLRGHPSVDRFSKFCLLLPVMIFFIFFSSIPKVNIGIRYILPVFPFLLVLAGSCISFWASKKRLLWTALLLPVVLWYIWESVSIYPHYLAYFNQFAGGPQGGYRHLVDSNLDWGQDLKGLKRYMNERQVEKIKLSYFGTGDPSQYGIQYEALPSFVLLNPQKACRAVNRGDLLAVSVTNLYPLYVDLGRLGAHLRQMSPIDHVGYSIFIYEAKEAMTFNP